MWLSFELQREVAIVQRMACAVAADARGPLSVFNVRTQCGRKGGIVEEVLMTSSRGIHKQQQITATAKPSSDLVGW
jgi:hypothetical protein